MSKSGVFAHFGSREELQISVIREYHARFEQEVFYPAMSSPRGIARLRALFDNWMKRTSIEIDSGCIYISGAVEFDDPHRPRARCAGQLGHDLARAPCAAPLSSARTAASCVRTPTEEQMLFEIHGLILALHYEARFLQNPGSIERAVMGFQNILRATAPKVQQRRRHRRQSRPGGTPTCRCAAQSFRFNDHPPPRSKPMPTYTPPLRDMQFVMHEVFKVTDEFKAMPQHAEVDVDTINAVIEEAGKFASEVIFPLNISGDTEGCVLDKATHEVKTPTGFKEAYDKYVEGGWAALSCDPAYGGQGLPFVLNQCLYEMMNSANQAWTMYPGLRHGAYEALHAHGTDEQKKLYLPRLTSGEWTGTMCLTEPHCGTDLGLLRTKAEPQADGTYKLTGNKIFISAGEHDMAANIVHLVLARLPDAPAGSKGISLFVGAQVQGQCRRHAGRAQRHLLRRAGAQDGHPRQRHGADRTGRCHRHPGGPAAQGPGRHVRDDERRPPGRGQPVAGPDRSGLPERAGLRQGPPADALAVSGTKAKDKPADPIIVHPDVRKMLLTAKAYAEGGRALQCFCARAAGQGTAATPTRKCAKTRATCWRC